MEYVFDYEETRVKRIRVKADNLMDALQEVYDLVDDVTWGQKDFYAGELRMPLKDNYLPQIREAGESVARDVTEDMDLVVDFW